jgi:RHS repeat-associated protein
MVRLWLASVDADGRLTWLQSVFSKTISYNIDNTIFSINDSAYPDLNETYSYNAQSRLTETTRSADPQSFSIDSDGNRTSATRAGVMTNYPIASASNKVTSWSYMGGDIYSDGTRYYTRDEFDRLSMVTISGQVVGQYRYDALDRRVYKATGQGTTYFVYATNGQLLYEQSAQRSVNYVWLAGRLVGISINHGALQSVHTDWLGRPELVTGTSSPTIAWRASNAVYDRKVTLDSLGGLNVFFPGQYYDAESNLYYNWHRYYDANSGRYVQSDPLGLKAGINTYGYSLGNPISHTDPSGLQSLTDGGFSNYANYISNSSRGPFSPASPNGSGQQFLPSLSVVKGNLLAYFGLGGAAAGTVTGPVALGSNITAEAAVVGETSSLGFVGETMAISDGATAASFVGATIGTAAGFVVAVVPIALIGSYQFLTPPPGYNQFGVCTTHP